MRTWVRIGITTLCSAFALFTTACGPAVQSMTGDTAKAGNSSALLNPEQSGTLLSPSGWSTLAAAVEAGTQVQYYKEQLNATIGIGSLHSTYSVYGSLNPPGKAYLALREGNTSTDYFQQGQVAYALDNGRWSLTQSIQDLNVYPSYQALVAAAQNANVPLYQQKRMYVFDEYCDVYTSVLPAGMLSPLPAIGSLPKGTLGEVAVTWYVGQTDHILRRVDMQSVGGLSEIGEMQVSTSTLLFDINNPVAKVSVPKDLEKQLENIKG